MMGFFDKVKKAFGSKKDDESQNYVNDETIDKPEPIESIENNDENLNRNEEIKSEDSEETPVNEEVIDKPTPNDKIRKFKYLDDLIHSGLKEIVLDSDIILDEDEKFEYKDGIKLDVDDLVIDGNGHAVDARRKTRFFLCTGKNITIKNIILKEGYASLRGGAIYNDDGELTITKSTLTGNRSKESGGAIYNRRGELTITESALTGNTAEEYFDDIGEGGAIYNGHGELTITKSALTGNTSQKRGGAIYNDHGELTITKSTLTGNTSKESGGAIYNTGGELTIMKSTLSGNTSQEMSLFSGGGAIYNNSSLTITESTLQENTADYGGAILNDKGSLTITKSPLQENTAQKGGGAILNDKGSLTIIKSTLQENTAKDCGAVYSSGDFKIYDSKFLSNESLGRTIILNRDSLQIYNTAFRNNQSESIVMNGGEGNLGIFNGEFSENNFERSVLYNTGKFCVVEKTLFKNKGSSKKTVNIRNESELTLKSPKIKDTGKTILNKKYILIKNSPELENKIYGRGTVETAENMVLQEGSFDFGCLDKKIHESKTKEIILDHDITFENYERDYYEGGIELDMDDLIINGNGHIIDGADKSRIFIITGKNITLKNIIFKNGHMQNNYDTPINNNGGAIKINHDCNITIENCEFIKNISEGNGGAIYTNWGRLTITKSTLQKNTAQMYGGAIYNRGELTITKSTLTGNTAKENGGAIYTNRGSLTITESRLEGNTANPYGVICGGNSIITDCKIDDLNGVEGNFEFRLTSNGVEEFKSKTGESFSQVKTVNDVTTFKRLIGNNNNSIRLGSNLSIGEMEISANDIIIDGNGHTIYGSGAEGIFIVTGKNITFKNITFSGGRCTSDGRDAAYNNGRTSRYQEIHFYYYGGAIYVPRSGDCTCIDCNFKDNVVGNDEMAKIGRERINVCYEAQGGAIYASGACKLMNCHFKKNKAISGGSANCNGCTEVIILDE